MTARFFSVCYKYYTRDHKVTVVMDQHLESKSNDIVGVEAKETNNKENSNKCDYSSSRTGQFIRHLKTHGGERSNKCNQCDYASSQDNM